jgi:hypothetical protein
MPEGGFPVVAGVWISRQNFLYVPTTILVYVGMAPNALIGAAIRGIPHHLKDVMSKREMAQVEDPAVRERHFVDPRGGSTQNDNLSHCRCLLSCSSREEQRGKHPVVILKESGRLAGGRLKSRLRRIRLLRKSTPLPPHLAASKTDSVMCRNIFSREFDMQ